MAYNSRVTGEWRIDPPLDDRSLRGLLDFQWIRVRIEESVSHLDDGATITRRRGVAVEPAQEGEWNYYTLADELTTFLSNVSLHVKIDGYIVREGEEQGDVERYLPHLLGGTELETERASLRWPDGTAAP